MANIENVTAMETTPVVSKPNKGKLFRENKSESYKKLWNCSRRKLEEITNNTKDIFSRQDKFDIPDWETFPKQVSFKKG